MSRYFAIQSWVSSHDNEPDYSGQQTGSRHVRSVEIPMYTQHGKANVDWFSDEQIALRNGANKPKPSIKDKILPQAKRLTTLRQQMVELEQEYKTTDMSISEYSVLRDVLFAKAQRAEVLYRKAIAQKPVQNPEDGVETPYTNHVNAQPNNGHTTEVGVGLGGSFIDELSETNSLKSFLKSACKVVRTVRYCSHKVSKYIQTLKEV
jgi:hypothetical protein